MRKNEMVVVSTIYILIIVLFMLVTQMKETEREEAAKLEAMSIAIDLNKSNNEYIVMLDSMNNYADTLEKEIKEYEYIERLKKDLDRSRTR